MTSLGRRITEALEEDDTVRVVDLVRDNLAHICRCLKTTEDVDKAILGMLTRGASEDEFRVKPMASRVELAHECFNLENPDG